jgi:hypothetical protein
VSTAILERLLVECDGCGQTVLRTLPPVRLLDADLTPGGLYQVDEHGHARRRSLTQMFTERRVAALTFGGGHAPHDCSRSAVWSRRWG